MTVGGGQWSFSFIQSAKIRHQTSPTFVWLPLGHKSFVVRMSVELQENFSGYREVYPLLLPLTLTAQSYFHYGNQNPEHRENFSTVNFQ